MSFDRLENENEEQFLWRIGKAKDDGLIDLDWSKIADIMNKEFRSDESEYRTEAAYRKPYQQAKRFYESRVFHCFDDNSVVKELREERQAIRREKEKLFDERKELNRKLREQARTENDLAYLRELISERGFNNLPEHEPVISDGTNDMIVCVSDFHLGIENNNDFGCYNSAIAARRLNQYADEIIRLQKVHNTKNAYVVFLGDLISGECHFTIQLENRERLTEQIQTAAELLSSFVNTLSAYFEKVYVNGVAGNHSRTSFKDETLRGNRLDNLIPWYMKASLQHVENVHFIDNNNPDATIGKITVYGKDYLLVHGDYDSFSEAGVSKLVMMIGYKPEGVFMGHMHHNSYDDIAGVKIIRSGSFAGTGDNYCIEKRLYGKPSQMVTIVNADGIECCYPIDLY